MPVTPEPYGEVKLSDVLSKNKFTVLYFYNQDFSQGCSIEAGLGLEEEVQADCICIVYPRVCVTEDGGGGGASPTLALESTPGFKA